MAESMAARKGSVDFALWLRRIVTWDALMIAIVATVPFVVQFVLPNGRGVMEFAAVFTPIVAFFVRYREGRRQIWMNRCSPTCRLAQWVAFFIGILVLALVDCVLTLSHIMPKGALFATHGDRIVWMSLVAVYLAAMSIAMYRGRAVIRDNSVDSSGSDRDNPDWRAG